MSDDKPGNGNGNGHHIQMPASAVPAQGLTDKQKIVVTICEALLKLAKDGHLASVAFTASHSSDPNKMVSGRSPHYDDLRLIGHLELMKDGAIRRIRAAQS